MKKKLIAGLAILLVLCLMNACKSPPVPNAAVLKADNDEGILKGLLLVLDAGHGGFDIGTQGIYSKVPESKVNLAIAKALEKALQDEGVQVVMTREGEGAIAGTKDEDMQKRADIIRAVNPDIMISIHQNKYEDSDICGPQVFYLIRGSKAQTLANFVQSSLNLELGIKNPRIAMSGEYKMLRPGTGPSIIVECGFLSNPREDKLLQDPAYQKKLVQAIVDGLKNFTANNFIIPV
ncbi:MAG: N-acetylmuramoyl-L-alanine amidase [Eubacteriales bacterium]